MKKIAILLVFVCSITLCFSQNARPAKVGWFVSPEVGGIVHGDHIGKTVGVSLGIQLFNDHLKLGIQGYGRSGTINPREFYVTAFNEQSYRGSTTLRLRADHGTFGLLIAPTFTIKNFKVDVPIALGQLGGGFYLTGQDRDTPDGRRVSEWENELMDGRDTGFGGWIEFGTRVFFPLSSDHVAVGAGLHYTLAPGWETYYSPRGDFYNNRLRFSLVVSFESVR